MKDYVLAWLQSMELGFIIGSKGFDVYLLFISMCLSMRCQHIALSFPRYGFVITNSDYWIYIDRSKFPTPQSNYWFYHRNIYGNLGFYIMHVKGSDAIAVDKEAQ